MVMNTEGHIETNGPFIKDRHTGHLPQEDQVGDFPTNNLVEEDPLEEDTMVGDPLIEEDNLGPQEDKDHQALKDQQDL